MNDLALLFDLFGNSEETKLLICTAIFVWCLQRHRNGGLNSGQKSAIIVTDDLDQFLGKLVMDLKACWKNVVFGSLLKSDCAYGTQLYNILLFLCLLPPMEKGFHECHIKTSSIIIPSHLIAAMVKHTIMLL